MGASRTRRRRSIITEKKTTAHRRFTDHTEEDIAFAQMIPAYAFDVYIDQLDQGYACRRVLFKKGDDVMLHSTWDSTDDLWIGRIHQIRTTPDRSNTLVKVQWYWSRNDIAKHVKSFDPSQCAPLERVLSDDYDYVSPYAFEKVVHVYEYDESALDPPMLGPQDLFVRVAFLHRKKTIKPPLGFGTCRCEVAYNPFPSPVHVLSSETQRWTRPEVHSSDLMHFCPSLKCRKWYHSSCLRNMLDQLDTLPPQTRGLRLLAVNPDEEVPFASFEYFYELESQSDITHADEVTLPEALLMLDRSPDIVAHLPPSLLAIAQSPIVRCSGAPAGFAIGNVADVVLARRLVYAAVQNSGSPERDPHFASLLVREAARVERLAARARDPFWSESMDGDDGEEDVLGYLERLCEELDGFALLASPRSAYWEQRESEYKELGGLFEGPAYLCPHCRGAI
ncbi:hypothetical protein BV20DRAFT_1002180 [Pilatotrama ljubarskyi]|nr:hypothetical protein BV20DRAFT_1002180 [Pilatotrama ljubarskyi]